MSDSPQCRMENSWESLDRHALEQQYSPSSCVDNFDELVAAYASESRKSEARARVLKDLKYGRNADELLDFFPARDSGSALHVFIHGGYWQALSKDDSTFAGADFVDQGIAYAAVNYTLAPTAKIAHMVEQCRNSIRWLFHNAADLGFNNERIYLSGSSAGAQLAAMVMLATWEAYELPQNVIKGATLLSGIYDLRPLCHTYVNDPLKMDQAEALSQSPQFMDLSGMPPAIICWGENETAQFKRQSQEFAIALQQAGTEVESFELPGYNHFDIVHALADPRTKLGSRVLAQIRA